MPTPHVHVLAYFLLLKAKCMYNIAPISVQSGSKVLFGRPSSDLNILCELCPISYFSAGVPASNPGTNQSISAALSLITADLIVPL